MILRTKLLAAGGALAGTAVLVGGALLLLGGDGEEPPPTTTTTTTSTSTTTTVPRPRAPLTGLPVDDPSVLARPALIVKVDNADYLARPQAGLQDADIVFEEQVEGGVTRFAVVFHSTDSEMVGPIRSARTTDIAIAANLGQPLFAYSGASEAILQRVREAPLVDLGADWHPEYYHRRSDRTAPDNLFSDTGTLWSATPEGAQPPQALFAYRELESDGGGEAGSDGSAQGDRISRIDYTFAGGASVPVAWRWDPEEEVWLREQNGTDHLLEGGEPIAVDNLILQFVSYVDTGIRDIAGSPVPEAVMVGAGDAWVLSQGRAEPGQWSRPETADLTVFSSGDEPVELRPGRTWIALVPTGNASLTSCADDPGAAGCG